MSRVVRFLGRTKAYITECKQNMAPMPNPEWYQEEEHERVSLKNLRKLPLSAHVEVWSSTWKWYIGSFEESFAWGQRRKEEAKKKEAEEKLGALQGMVRDAREATHNTPEDLEKSKQALKELLEEIHENRDGLKSAAQEKLDLIRVSLSAFSSGYREARDEEIKRVMAMDQGMLQSFLSERAGEVKHATSIISDAIMDTDKDKDDSGRSRATRQVSAGAASGTITGGVAQPPPPAGTLGARPAPGGGVAGASTPDVIPGTAPGGEDAGGPSRFLSQRTRQAVDDVLRDPDLERLAGRARGFARDRLLQAEAAARVLKEEGGEEEGEEDVAGQRPGPRGGRGREGRGGGETPASWSGSKGPGESDSETPIISGLMSEASEFVGGRVGQAKEGVREVVEAAVDVRRSRRTAAAAAKRPEKDRVEGGGGGDGSGSHAVGGMGEAGEGGKKAGTS